MSQILTNARPSPRVEQGRLWWYEGDTFKLDILLQLKDQDGETLTAAEEDSVEFTFRDGCGRMVYTVTFTGLTDNRVTLTVDSAVTGQFPRGEYTYDVRYLHGDRTTLARDNRLRVE